MKCPWGEAIGLYKEYVLQSRRCIQLSVLGKGPYTLALPYQHLAVTAAAWSGMSRAAREKHLGKLGVSHAEVLNYQEEGDETSAENMHAVELLGSFTDLGLPELVRGSWSYANQILQLEGNVPFPNDAKKQNVISLTRSISHIIEIAGKEFICWECLRFAESGIYAHTLAVTYQVGKLKEYTKSYRVPLD